MLWNIYRKETKNKTGEFSKSGNTWKNSCFEGFFYSRRKKKFSPVLIFSKFCVVILWVTLLLMMCVICPGKFVLLQTGTISKKTKFSQNNAKIRSPTQNFRKCIFSIIQYWEYLPSNFEVKIIRIHGERIFSKLFLFVKNVPVVLP